MAGILEEADRENFTARGRYRRPTGRPVGAPFGLSATARKVQAPQSSSSLSFPIPPIPEGASEPVGRRRRECRAGSWGDRLLWGAGCCRLRRAGRLGHGGGGSTTLREYAAFVGEADRRAAEILGTQLSRPMK